jgi:hypothetical protein
MHPDLTKLLVEARRADLLAQAEERRLARRPRSSRSCAAPVTDEPLRAVLPLSRAVIVDCRHRQSRVRRRLSSKWMRRRLQRRPPVVQREGVRR